MKAKFRQSAVLFPSKLEKIDYVRDHCKGIAFNVIKIRADPASSDLYTHTQKIITDLYYIFKKFDKITSSDAKIHNPNFKIDTVNKNEIFDIFYTRFYAEVVFFNYNDD